MRTEGGYYGVDGIRKNRDLAVVWSALGGTVRHQSGPTTIVDHRELFALHRSSEGWRITDYTFNSPAAISS